MSGITPILDTLLHQVLGRRGVPLERDPNIPVKPLEPGRAPLALHSDSRLDPRPLPGGPTDKGRPPLPATVSGQSGAGVEGAATHFSPAARTIADVLARFPAPPSALRPLVPLSNSNADAPEDLARQLAAGLRDSVESSGLFYEAHLRRWLQGDFELRRLARESRMRIPGQPATAPAGGNGTPSGLENLLRHQLEMLVNPVLRWEGEPWAGVFMALALHAPPDWQQPHDEQRNDRRHREQTQAWQSRVTVKLARLGEVTVSVNLQGSRLSLDMSASEAAASRLDQGSAVLRGRLTSLGFEEVRLRISTRSERESGERNGRG